MLVQKIGLVSIFAGLLICTINSANAAGGVDEFLKHKNQGILEPCLSGKADCYIVAGAENKRFKRPVMGYIEIDRSGNMVYGQDNRTKKVRGFRFDESTKRAAIQMARDYVIEQFLGLDLQTNALPGR